MEPSWGYRIGLRRGRENPSRAQTLALVMGRPRLWWRASRLGCVDGEMSTTGLVYGSESGN